MGVLFFVVIYLVLALPALLALSLLVGLLRKKSNSRTSKKIAFVIAALVLLTPFATQMADLFVGAAPIGYFLLAVPFASDSASTVPLVLMEYWRFHLAALLLTTIGAWLASQRLFPN